MNITVFGAGAVGTLLAFRLSRAGHRVTLVARGARLDALRRDRGVLRARSLSGGPVETATVDVSDSLDHVTADDMLAVTVRRQHADAALAAVARTRGAPVLFVFNVARALDRFRDAVGRERFAWGFPAVVARLEGDTLVSAVVPAALGALQITTLGAMPDRPAPALDAWRALFADAKIPTARCDDMPSWLATHAAFMAPLIAAGALCERERGLSFARATLVANAMREGFETVRRAGHRVIPRSMGLVSHAPRWVVAIALWLAFRTRSLRESLGGEHARDEATAMLEDLAGLSREPVESIVALSRAIAPAS